MIIPVSSSFFLFVCWTFIIRKQSPLSQLLPSYFLSQVLPRPGLRHCWLWAHNAHGRHVGHLVLEQLEEEAGGMTGGPLRHQLLGSLLPCVLSTTGACQHPWGLPLGSLRRWRASHQDITCSVISVIIIINHMWLHTPNPAEHVCSTHNVSKDLSNNLSWFL